MPNFFWENDMATSSANRGKRSEAEVKAVLKEIESKCMSFTHNRVPDAHAAGGRFTAQAGDFQAFKLEQSTYKTAAVGLTTGLPPGLTARSRNFILEVKELKHDFRLAHASYSPDKVARVQKRNLAGTECLVVLYHSTTKLWRAVPFEVFLTRTGGSWDLRAYPIVEIKHCLRTFFGISD